MSKYASPAVRLRDVLAALPVVPSPLAWHVGFRPSPGQSTKAKATVELCIHTPKGAQYVWRRWGKECSATSDTGPLSALLLAAQEAYWYLEAYDANELLRRVTWDLDVLLATAGGD